MITIYIDSDVIVASEIKKEVHHKQCKEFMEYALNKDDDITFITSIFTFLELASAMIRRTRNKDKTYSLLYRIKNLWKDSIKPYAPIKPKKMTSFTKLVNILVETSIRFRTPSGDTIHAHTVAAYNVDYLITLNKKHFSYMKRQIKNLKLLTPAEVLEEFKRIKKRKKIVGPEKLFKEYFKSLVKK